MTDLSASRHTEYKTKNKIRFVTAASLFDGHDAAINIMRRILQASGAEVIHLGHNRSVEEVVTAALQEDVQGIAVSSYQGGHLEYFKYMIDLLRERGGENIKVFGGGGGVIVAEEIRELQAYGVTRIYTPEDGQKMGLQGMINDMLARCDEDPSLHVPEQSSGVKRGDRRGLARLITALENGTTDLKLRAQILKEADALSVPTLGVTGTGGSGKSSLADELVRRFRLDQEDRLDIAILAVDPSRRKSGGALLGDRIRMNAIEGECVFMRSLATRGERAHEDALPFDGVHPDTVAEQRTAGFPPRRIDGEDSDVEPVLLVEAEAAHQLVGERGFSRASGARHPERRYGERVGFLQNLRSELEVGRAVLERRDQPSKPPAVASLHAARLLGHMQRRVLVAAREHVVDHALQTHLLAVFGRINARDAVGLQLANLLGDDHPAAAAEHLDVFSPALAQQVDHVLEVLEVTALVGGDRDPLDVFLQRGGHDFVDRAIVPEMDHFGAARLQDAAHDVDCGVVAVEERRRRHEADLVLRLVFGVPGGTQIGHGCPNASGSGWRKGRLLDVYVNVKRAPSLGHSLSLRAAVHPVRSRRGAAAARW